MAKETKVSLLCIATDTEEEFEVSHAERILAIMDSGWCMPEDSDYEYKDGTINRRDKKKGK